MKKTNKINRIKIILLSFLLIFSSFFSCLNLNTACGATSVDTPTIPSTTSDYTIAFKELKEENNEVFVYVYQFENEDIVYASSINISTSLESLNFRNYKLEYNSKTLSSSAVTSEELDLYVYKYLVKNLTISSSTKRVYEISSIYRPFVDGDYETSTQTTTEKAFAVERCYTFLTNEDGTTSVSVLETETVYITDKFVGFVRYEGGYLLSKDCTDRYFVAFATDKQIDTLKEADVYYTTTSYITLEDVEPVYEDHYVSLTSNKQETIHSGLFWLKKYTWNEIQTTSDFVSNLAENKAYNLAKTDITSSLVSELSEMTHVLNFTTLKHDDSAVGILKSKKVGDVSILRLKFETGGTLFEYGVVDNKTTGSTTPVAMAGDSSLIDNIIGWFVNFFSDVKRVIIIVILVILFFIALPWILPCIPPVLEFLFGLIKVVISFFIWLVTLPIKIFKRD
ncbi:MAG: hypothetical protein IJW32_04040 [Clostridia bacterium]|nr:hypothetical protein [Clostridia bacterium]